MDAIEHTRLSGNESDGTESNQSPTPGLKGQEWGPNHELLHSIIAGTRGARNEEVHKLYKSIAPVALKGTLEVPVNAKRRNELLAEMLRAGVVDVRVDDFGTMWFPPAPDDTIDDSEFLSREREDGVHQLRFHEEQVFLAIEENGPITPRELYKAYCERVDDPRARRSVKRYTSKLLDLALVGTRGRKRSRVYYSRRGSGEGT